MNREAGRYGVPELARNNSFFKVTGPGTYGWFEARSNENKRLQPGDVRVATILEVPSPGTFRGYHTGRFAKLNGFIDSNTGLYIPGRPQESYPIAIGYAEAGVVVDSRHRSFKQGQLVGGDYTFQTLYTGNPTETPNALWKIDPDLHPSLASFPRKLLPIVGNAILHAADALSHKKNLKISDIRKICEDSRFIVNGAGPLGILSAKWLQELGAQKVAIADIDQERIALARRMGIDAYNPNNYQGPKGFQTFVKEELMPRRDGNSSDRLYGPGADVVLEFSGSPAGLANAFDLAQNKGVIVLGGMYPDAHFSNMYQQHISGQTLVGAQIGDVPRLQYERWVSRDRLSAFSEAFLFAPDVTSQHGRTNGDTIREELITHFAPFSAAEVVYPALMDNDPIAITNFARNPAVNTTGYGLLFADNLPLALAQRFQPESLYDKEVPTREIVELYERNLEKSHILEMGGGYTAIWSEGALKVENGEGRVMFENATGSIELSDGRVISTKDAKITQVGNTISLEVSGIKDQPDMKVAIVAEQDRPGLRITQEITNSTDKEIGVNRFVQLDLQEGLHGVPTDEEAASAIGYMSWSAPIHRKVSLLDIKHDFRYIPQVASIMEGGQRIAEAVHMQSDGDNKQMLIGHLPTLGASRHQGIVELHNTDPRIVAWNDGENIALAPGQSRKSEETLILFGTDRNTGLETHAKEVAQRAGFVKTPNEKPYVGVCTWSWAFGKLQPEHVRGAMDKIESIESSGVPIDLMQIDDLGAARHPHGDWVGELNNFLQDEFGGLRGFTDSVHAQGEEAGVWMAPGFVSEHSPLHAKIMSMKEPGEWYVKGADGEPMVEHHWWEGKFWNQYILDMTNPEVQDHIKAQLQGLKEAGVDYIKLDFLYNLITPGKRARNDLTSVEAYNEFFKIFDEVWEEEDKKVKVNVCGAPFYKTAGKFAVRGGADVLADNAPQWYKPNDKDNLNGGAAQNSVLANFTRLAVLAEMYQRIDPDSTVTRLEGDSILTSAEVRTIAASARMGADALITIGDDPQSIQADQLNLLKLAISDGEPAKPVAFEHGKPTIIVRQNGLGKVEVSTVNWGDFDTQDYVIPAELIGLTGRGFQLRDLTTDEVTLHLGENLMIEQIPGHGIGVYEVQPV